MSVLYKVVSLICVALGSISSSVVLPASNPLAAPLSTKQREAYQGSKEYAYPGGVAELWISKATQNLPTVRYGLNQPVIIDSEKYWQILIGLSLQTLPGEYVAYVKENDAETPAYSLPFNVVHRAYSIMQSGLDSDSTNQDFDQLSELDFENTEQPKLPLCVPVSGQWADNFGFLRLEQDSDSDSGHHQLQNYVSYSTTELSTVNAPSNAIVSRILFESPSNEASDPLATIFLDHGRGLYSIISGITDLSVELGNGVVAGAVIGKLPSTNDNISTLYWRCSMNGVLVNPMILTKF